MVTPIIAARGGRTDHLAMGSTRRRSSWFRSACRGVASLVAVVPVVTSGCLAAAPELFVDKPPPRAWGYVPAAPRGSAPLVEAMLSVTPLADVRDPTIRRREWLALLPLVPSGTGIYGDPSALAGAVGSPYAAEEPWAVDFAQVVRDALVEELRNACVFRGVVVEAVPSGEFVLSGELRATELRRTMTCYGLSFVGSLVWLAGTPAHWVRNDLDVHLVLTRRASDRTVWTYDLSAVARAEGDVYDVSSERWREFLFDRALAEAMPELVRSIESAARRGFRPDGAEP